MINTKEDTDKPKTHSGYFVATIKCTDDIKRRCRVECSVTDPQDFNEDFWAITVKIRDIVLDGGPEDGKSVANLIADEVKTALSVAALKQHHAYKAAVENN